MSRGTITTAGLTLMLAALVLFISNLNKPEAGISKKPLVLYCAAGVKPAVLPLAKKYERESGQAVQIMYGGSGTLLSNIEVTRQGDLYIAADQSYMEIAARKHLIAETLPLARMRPVIAVAKGNPKNIRSLKDLTRPDIRLALGNPDAASIGKQTKIHLQRAGIWNQVKQQVERNGVFKPTVPEVANDVKLGAVDAGVIWDATSAQYPELEAVRIPLFDEQSELISVAVLKSCKQAGAALRFARFLNSQLGNAQFTEWGFDSIEGDIWTEHPVITIICDSVTRQSIKVVVETFEAREGVTVNLMIDDTHPLTNQFADVIQTHDDTARMFSVSSTSKHKHLARRLIHDLEVAHQQLATAK